MTTTTAFLLGRHITAQVASLVIDEATGSITPGSFTAITATLDSYQGETSLLTENISTLSSLGRNPVPLETGTLFELSELMKNASTPSVLRALFAASSYFCG